MFDSKLLDTIACTLGVDKHEVYVSELEYESDEDLYDELESMFDEK